MRNLPARRFRPLPLVVALAGALAPMHVAAQVYTVTTSAPFGPGSFDDAIQFANSNCGLFSNITINFAVGATPITISPNTFFTDIGDFMTCLTPYNLLIDGTTQPGSQANSLANGTNAIYGVTINGSLLTFPGCGIPFVGGGSVTVRGIRVTGYGFGGQGACNVNTSGGAMYLYGNKFDGNNTGIFANMPVAATPPVMVIGTTAPADRNFIHNNPAGGIVIQQGGASTIVGNYIGTADGTTAGPNGQAIQLSGGSGSTMIQSNVIGGNAGDGINLGNQAQALVTGNLIGVTTGGGALGNSRGIVVNNAAATVLIDIHATNVIKNSTGEGVLIQAGTNVNVWGNSITGNGGKNMSLNFGPGPLPPDLQDPDGGPNLQQNAPAISTVTSGGATTNVNYTFNSTPLANFNLDFYANSAMGQPGGETYITTVNVTTDSNGDYNATQVLGSVYPFVSMAARDVTGNTSEFSLIVPLTGTPAVTVSSNLLDFGSVPISTTSPTLTSTLTSSGTANWDISQIGSPFCYGGPVCYGGAEFSCMSTCAYGSYAPASGCAISAFFSPTSLGPQSLTVQICDNAPGSPRTITLQGIGVSPSALSLSASSHSFGDVPVGTASAPAIFSVQNTGPTSVAYTTSTSGPFAIAATTCPNPIPASSGCDFDVTFNPTAAGTASGTFTVSGAGSSSSVSLLGNGIVAPQLLLPGGIDFNFVLGSTPLTQSLVLQNTGSARLNISSITIDAPFTLVNPCPAFLLPGESCTLTLGFSASDRGEFFGTLTIITNAPGGSRGIRLRGLSQPKAVPVLEVTPREIGFGDRSIGTPGEGSVIRIRNIGGAPAVFDSIVASPDFVILAHSCDRPLQPLQTCEALVTMRPLSYGTRSGKFIVNSNAENGPNSVNIFGTGCRGAGVTLGRVGITRGCAP